MILNVYNTHDERAREYGTPIFTQFDEQQMAASYAKSVQDAVIRLERMSQIDPAKSAEFAMQASQLQDCVIYNVGVFNSKTGSLELHEPELVCRLSEFFPRDFHFVGGSEDA